MTVTWLFKYSINQEKKTYFIALVEFYIFLNIYFENVSFLRQRATGICPSIIKKSLFSARRSVRSISNKAGKIRIGDAELEDGSHYLLYHEYRVMSNGAYRRQIFSINI